MFDNSLMERSFKIYPVSDKIFVIGGNPKSGKTHFISKINNGIEIESTVSTKSGIKNLQYEIIKFILGEHKKNSKHIERSIVYKDSDILLITTNNMSELDIMVNHITSIIKDIEEGYII